MHLRRTIGNNESDGNVAFCGRWDIFGDNGRNLAVPGTFIEEMGTDDNLSVSSSELQLSAIRASKESSVTGSPLFERRTALSVSLFHFLCTVYPFKGVLFVARDSPLMRAVTVE